MNRVSLISTNVKRLSSRKLLSLQDDLDNVFEYFENNYNGMDSLPHRMAWGKDFEIYKPRVAISRPKLSTSKGARLWVYINIVTNTYYESFLYLAVEEDRVGFKASDCRRIVLERLKDYLH